MSSKHTRGKCRFCKTLFIPDRHNPSRQFFCSAPACRRASKAASQRRWLSKPANRNYFRDEKNVERVQEWRKAHPGYWKRTKSPFKPSQDADSQPVIGKRDLVTQLSRDLEPLQDLVLTEHPAFVGLISLVTGSTLQEDIAAVTRNLLRQGQNILGVSPGKLHKRMIQKRLIRPDRIRQVPPSFNWVDHRLVRDNYISRCDCTALALYLFLVTVSDVQGLSYYSDAAICRRLNIEPLQLCAARRQLQQADLIAYRKPLYQVLSLGPSDPTTAGSTEVARSQQTQSVADILKRALQGGDR